jgi:hypothetical protein
MTTTFRRKQTPGRKKQRAPMGSDSQGDGGDDVDDDADEETSLATVQLRRNLRPNNPA